MRAALLLASLNLSAASYADLPLTVEDLITYQGKLKLDTTLVYGNSESQGVAVGDSFVIQTGPTSFVALSGRIGESRANNDSLIGTAGLRYGLSVNAEIYGRLSSLKKTPTTQ